MKSHNAALGRREFVAKSVFVLAAASPVAKLLVSSTAVSATGTVGGGCSGSGGGHG